AHAQLSTATVNGQVSENAAARAGATVVATQVGTGFVIRSTSDQGGAYVLPGLRPGRYQITATAPDGRTASQVLDVQVGQTATLDLAIGAPAATAVSELVVTAAAPHARETKTSEVATNITTLQIENLPQSDRNFLNFAILAPGIRLSTDPLRKTFAGGANGSAAESLTSSQTNVFIDGVSLKSNVQQGG